MKIVMEGLMDTVMAIVAKPMVLNLMTAVMMAQIKTVVAWKKTVMRVLM